MAEIFIFSKNDAAFRITSYNVCYTKLLRPDSPGFRGAVAAPISEPHKGLPKSSGDETVITSYSIHYTKLYDLD